VSIRGSNTTSEQISGWKAQPKSIRVHSCPFVVQTPLPATIRENPCSSVAKKNIRGNAPAFAASRENNSLQSYPNADTQQHRSRAAKPNRNRFVNIRVHSWFKHHPLRLSVKIRVHPWRKNIRGNAPAFAASRENNSLQSYPNADTQQHRSRAAKPNRNRFVNIRVHSWFKHHSLRLSVKIRVHQWRKKHPWQRTGLPGFP